MKLSLILLFVFICTVKSQFTGRCTANPVVCCKGVNSACRRGDCYCDEYCTANKDCCPDFLIACNGGVSSSATTGTTPRTTIASNAISAISMLGSILLPNTTTGKPNVSTPPLSSSVPFNLTQNASTSSVLFTAQSTTPTTSRLPSTISSLTSPVILKTSSGSNTGLLTSAISLLASNVAPNNTNNLLLNINPSTTLRTSVMPTAASAQTSNIINGTTTNTVATMQLLKVTSSGIITNNGSNLPTSVYPTVTTQMPQLSSITSTLGIALNSTTSTTIRLSTNITTSGVLSNATNNIPSVNNTNSTMSSIMTTPSIGAVTNLSTTKQEFSSTNLPDSISSSSLLSNVSGNVPLVNNASSTLKTTSAPTMSSIMITPSTGAITNLSITIQMFSTATVPTTISTTTGTNSGGALTTAFTATRANGLSVSTNGIVSSFVSSFATSSSNDITSSRFNNVSTSVLLSSMSSNVPSAISTTTTLRTAIQTSASAASTSNVSSVSTSSAAITLTLSNGTGMSGNVSSSNFGYNISNFVTSFNSARTTELPIVSNNISTLGMTSNIVRTAGVNTTASGMFSSPTNNFLSTINTTTAPIVSYMTAVASSSIGGLKTNATSPTTTMPTSATSNQFTAKSSSDTSAILTTTGISVTSSNKTIGSLTATVGSTSSLGSNGSSFTRSDSNSKPPLGITEMSTGKTTTGNTSNTLIPNVTKSNATAFTTLSIPAIILGLLSNATSDVMTPFVALRPTGVSALPSTSYENNTASSMQIIVSTISASGKTPDTYSNPVTKSLNATSSIRVTGPPSADGVSNENSLQTTLAVIGTNASGVSGSPIADSKTSLSPIVSSSVLVFNATMSLRPSGGVPIDITTRAVTAPNTITSAKINETIQTTRASASNGSLSTSRMPNNFAQSLPASSMEATSPATVIPTQSIISTGIVSNTLHSIMKISAFTGLTDVAAVTIKTSTIATQSNISNLLTTLAGRVLNSASLTNQTGVTVSGAANSTAEPTLSTLNRVQFYANSSTNYLLSQGVSSSTSVPTVQRVAADPLMPQNKSADLLQMTYATPTGLSTVNTSRPINMPLTPIYNSTQTLNLPPLSQSNQVPTVSTVPDVMTGTLMSTSSRAYGNSPGTNLPLETTASYTTTRSKSATSNSTKKKNLISILWSLIFPALVSIKNSYQTNSRLNVTPKSAMNDQNLNYNLTGITDLNPAATNLSTKVQKQENNIEIIHVNYWRIKGGGSLSQPDRELREDNQDTDIMESLSVLTDNNFNNLN